MLKKIFLITVAVLAVGFLTIQFFQPAKNRSPVTENDFIKQINAPEDIKEKIKVSCYDCHSNQTKYPWYNKVAPLSWIIADHVKNGKKEINFSEWGHLSKRKKIGVLSGISEVLGDGSMPLESYIKLHKEAHFTGEEVERITTWTESAMEEVLSTPSE